MSQTKPATNADKIPVGKVVKTEAEWRKTLTSEQCHVLREGGTEPAFTGKYWNTHTRGVYKCAACGLELFRSETKYDSGTGWPSFWKAVAPDRVKTRADKSYGLTRTEIICARCGSHLGHVFNDGPQPTGQRFCTNSAALQLVESPKSP